MSPNHSVTQAVARQVLLGQRESLTIAGQLRCPPEQVNAALLGLRASCDGCIVLTRPYATEARLVVSVVAWHALKRVAGFGDMPREASGISDVPARGATVEIL